MKHFNNVLYSESHFPDDSKKPRFLCHTSSKIVGLDRLRHILIVHPYIKYIVYGLCFMWPRCPK